MPNRRYQYETDDFVVSDSEVEYVSSKTKPARNRRKQSTSGRQRDAHASDARTHQPATQDKYANSKDSSDTSVLRAKSSKIAKKAKSACNRTARRDEALLRELADLAPHNAPPKKSSIADFMEFLESEDDLSHPQYSRPVKKVKPARNHALHSRRKKSDLSRELADLAPYNAPPKSSSKEDFMELSGLEEEVSRPHINKTTPKSKPTSSRPAIAKAAKKDKRITDMFRISKKSRYHKTTRPKPTRGFEELTDLVIEQKGFCEWQNNLLYREGEYQYHRSVSVSSSQRPKGMNLLKLPGELRNRIYHILLENEQEITIKKQSSAEGFRRSARRGADKSRFQSYALAQTCRQLRFEYLPWLRQTRRVRVGLMEMYEYLDVFHRADDIDEPDQRAEGHVEPTWDDFAIPEGIDVLPLAKIAGASPKLHFYLEPAEDEVRFPQYHELTTMKRIVESYAQWRHIVSAVRLKSIRLFSEENRLTWYKYDRYIELHCRRALPGRADMQKPLIGSWVFKSGMYEREDLYVSCDTARGMHVWEPRGMLKGFLVDYSFEACEDNPERECVMRVDVASKLGYRVLG